MARCGEDGAVVAGVLEARRDGGKSKSGLSFGSGRVAFGWLACLALFIALQKKKRLRQRAVAVSPSVRVKVLYSERCRCQIAV